MGVKLCTYKYTQCFLSNFMFSSAKSSDFVIHAEFMHLWDLLFCYSASTLFKFSLQLLFY